MSTLIEPYLNIYHEKKLTGDILFCCLKFLCTFLCVCSSPYSKLSEEQYDGMYLIRGSTNVDSDKVDIIFCCVEILGTSVSPVGLVGLDQRKKWKKSALQSFS